MVLVRHIKWKLHDFQDLTANQNNFVIELQCTDNVLVSSLGLLVGIYAKRHLLDGNKTVENQLVAGNKGLECFLASEKNVGFKGFFKKRFIYNWPISHNRLTSVN